MKKAFNISSYSYSQLWSLQQFDWDVLTLVVAELGSDEDDIDEEGQEYLEMLAKRAGEDGDDEDWEEDDAEETALEGYTTTVDNEDNFVDEYQIFKAILQSKMSRFVLHRSRSVLVECVV